MTLAEIIETSSVLTTGMPINEFEDKKLAVRYLNMINAELFRDTALINPYVTRKQQDFVTVDGIIDSDDYQNFYMIVDLVQTLGQLKRFPKQISINESVRFNTINNNVIENWYLFREGARDKIAVLPKLNNINIQLTWINNDDSEITVDESSDESLTLSLRTTSPSIVPTSHHQVYVDGLIYYLLQSDSGLKNTQELAESLERWKKGKDNLYAYLQVLSGKDPISTFSFV